MHQQRATAHRNGKANACWDRIHIEVGFSDHHATGSLLGWKCNQRLS